MARFEVRYIAGEVHSESVEADSPDDAERMVEESFAEDLRRVDSTEFRVVILGVDDDEGDELAELKVGAMDAEDEAHREYPGDPVAAIDSLERFAADWRRKEAEGHA